MDAAPDGRAARRSSGTSRAVSVLPTRRRRAACRRWATLTAQSLPVYDPQGTRVGLPARARSIPFTPLASLDDAAGGGEGAGRSARMR